MKNTITTAFSILLLSALAHAQSMAPSEKVSFGGLSIIASPVLSLEGKPVDASTALAAGGAFVVVGVVEGSAEVASVTLKNIANGSQYVVNVSGKAVKEASVMTSTSVRVVAESTGYAIMASGKLLAFIPNAIGQALLHQSQVQ